MPLTVVKDVWLEAGQAAILGKGVGVLLIEEEERETEELADTDEELLDTDEELLDTDEEALEEDELFDTVDDVYVNIVLLIEDTAAELDVEDTTLENVNVVKEMPDEDEETLLGEEEAVKGLVVEGAKPDDTTLDKLDEPNEVVELRRPDVLEIEDVDIEMLEDEATFANEDTDIVTTEELELFAVVMLDKLEATDGGAVL